MKTSNLAEITQSIKNGKPLTALIRSNAQLSAKSPIRKALAQTALATISKSDNYKGLENTINQIKDGAKLNDLEFSQLVEIRNLELASTKQGDTDLLKSKPNHTERKSSLSNCRRSLPRVRTLRYRYCS